MGFMGDRAFLIWSLALSGTGTTLTANGNSGGYSTAVQNKYSSADLRWVDALTRAVSVAGTAALKMTAIIAQSTPTTAQFLAVGRHSGSAGTYIALPDWGQVAWTITGTTPVFNQVEIALYGR